MTKFKSNKLTIALWLCLFLSLAGNIFLFFRAKEYRDGANEWLDKYTNVVEEYSSLSVYAEANKSLQADSIVAGRIVFYGTQVIKRWDMQNYISSWEAINRGVSGQWSSGLLLRFYQDVLTLKPEYVVIEISSYNLRPRFAPGMTESHLKSMVELARYNGIEPILTTMIPQRKGYDNYDNYSVMENLEKYNLHLREYCHRENIKLLDMYNILAGDDGYLNPELSFDAIDPNESGYELISNSLRNLLSE